MTKLTVAFRIFANNPKNRKTMNKQTGRLLAIEQSAVEEAFKNSKTLFLELFLRRTGKTVKLVEDEKEVTQGATKVTAHCRPQVKHRGSSDFCTAPYIYCVNPYRFNVDSDSTALSAVPGPLSSICRHVILQYFMSVSPALLLSSGCF
jgi:hypothetical protein